MALFIAVQMSRGLTHCVTDNSAVADGLFARRFASPAGEDADLLHKIGAAMGQRDNAEFVV
eukprot:6479898-Pyramimonas_sp.AAC.1